MNKATNELIGHVYGQHRQLTVTGIGPARCAGYVRIVKVHCSICANDPELHGDAIFNTTASAVVKNFLPCACRSFYRWTKEQNVIRVRRKCNEIDSELLSVSYGSDARATRIHMKCNKDGHVWDSSLYSLLSDKTGCHICQRRDHTNRMTKDEAHFNVKFMSTGYFPMGTKFFRTDSLQHFDVHCPDCSTNGQLFRAAQTPLGRGCRPCNCKAAGGFDKRFPGYVYVLKIYSDDIEFTGYGITGNEQVRTHNHKVNLRNEGFLISEFESFYLKSGADVQKIEQMLVKKFPRFSQNVEGFRKEATYPWLYDDVVSFIEYQLTLL